MRTIVTSKDRPAQLDLFLRSYYRYCRDAEYDGVYVLYTWSAECYREGYRVLRDMYRNVSFIRETDFRGDMVCLCNVPHVCLFVDDDVCIGQWAWRDSLKSLSDRDVTCFSLRMGLNITRSYNHGGIRARRKLVANNGAILRWPWRVQTKGDWGYPMSMDGHVFRGNELSWKMLELSFPGPNQMEIQLSKNPVSGDFMESYIKSKIVGIPANRVQDVIKNKNMEVSAHGINSKFLHGYQLDVPSINNNSVHHQAEYLWWRRV